MPSRARFTTSSYAARNCEKLSWLALLMFGTSSVRVPSFFVRSIATPRFTLGRFRRVAWPSTFAKPWLSCGYSSSARNTAKAIKCVYDALPRSFSPRCLLMMRRFSSSSFTGMRRSEVAVGTERLVSMFSTIFAAGPRSRDHFDVRFGCGLNRRSRFWFRRARWSCGRLLRRCHAAPSPSSSVKYDRHESSTSVGIAAKPIQQSLNIGGVRPKFFRDQFRQISFFIWLKAPKIHLFFVCR